MPAFCLHGDTLFLSGTYAEKESSSLDMQSHFGHKKRPCPFGHSLTPNIFEKRKASTNNCLRRSISLSISILTCTYFHCNAIHLPMYYQVTADLLPLFFQFNSSILFCIFSGLVNAQSMVAYNRIAFLRFR